MQKFLHKYNIESHYCLGKVACRYEKQCMIIFSVGARYVAMTVFPLERVVHWTWRYTYIYSLLLFPPYGTAGKMRCHLNIDYKSARSLWQGENFEKATEFVVDFSSEDPEPVDHESALVHCTTLHTKFVNFPKSVNCKQKKKMSKIEEYFLKFGVFFDGKKCLQVAFLTTRRRWARFWPLPS